LQSALRGFSGGQICAVRVRCHPATSLLSADVFAIVSRCRAASDAKYKGRIGWLVECTLALLNSGKWQCIHTFPLTLASLLNIRSDLNLTTLIDALDFFFSRGIGDLHECSRSVLRTADELVHSKICFLLRHSTRLFHIERNRDQEQANAIVGIHVEPQKMNIWLHELVDTQLYNLFKDYED
jgi:hypothetical protein